jgi:hypothetical protein
MQPVQQFHSNQFVPLQRLVDAMRTLHLEIGSVAADPVFTNAPADARLLCFKADPDANMP